MSTELDKYLSDMAPLPVLTPLKPAGEFPLIDARDVIVRLLNPGTPNQIEVMLPTVLNELAESGGGGGSTSAITVEKIVNNGTSDDGQFTNYTMVFSNGDTHDFSVRNGVTTGYAEGVRTIDERNIKFFAGEKEKYSEIADEDKKNLLAIITNDEMRTQVIDGIEELMAWKNQAKHYIYEFGDYPQLKKGSDFYIGNFPKNGALAGIVGIGLEIIYEQTVGEPHYMRFSANKVTEVTNIMNHSTRSYEVRFCATAGFTNDTGTCGTASMNLVVGAKGNELYITFENGSLLWMDDSEGAGSIKQGIERLDDGNFYLSSVSYLFAKKERKKWHISITHKIF